MSKREASSTITNNNSKDGKNSDKASVIRSKHSVTEQRRRRKIKERFQILREIIPHSEQKGDTASFLLEVIKYVRYLQEKVQKYEGSYQDWSAEPTKLMPWRNSHWRAFSFVGHPHSMKNGSGPGSMFPAKFDENNISIPPNMLTSTHNPVESYPSRDIACKSVDQQPELANKGISFAMPMQGEVSNPVRSDGVLVHPLKRPVSDAQSNDCPAATDTMNQHEELAVEGGDDQHIKCLLPRSPGFLFEKLKSAVSALDDEEIRNTNFFWRPILFKSLKVSQISFFLESTLFTNCWIDGKL